MLRVAREPHARSRRPPLPALLRLPPLLHPRLQIPWGRWRGGPLVVELSDVVLCVSAMQETDWEEGPALRRAQAAKQAALAAAELTKLGNRVAATGAQQAAGSAPAGGASSSNSSSWGWGIMDYVMRFLLGRLQFAVKNVHLYFEVRRAARPCGMLLTMQRARAVGAALAAAQRGRQRCNAVTVLQQPCSCAVWRVLLCGVRCVRRRRPAVLRSMSDLACSWPACRQWRQAVPPLSLQQHLAAPACMAAAAAGRAAPAGRRLLARLL